MRDHGIDYSEKLSQNKITYNIPDLMEIKPKTPAAQASMMELLGIKPELE